MNEENLIKAVALVKERYQQARVILFGSAARNQDNLNSDIDLCIIIKNPQERLVEISRNIRREIYPILHKPLDILVYDKKIFEDRSTLPTTMEAEIIEQGKEL